MPAELPGFLVVWDPDGNQRSRCAAWARDREGQLLFAAGPVAAFGFGNPPLSPAAWEAKQTAGVFLGEFYNYKPTEPGHPNTDRKPLDSPVEAVYSEKGAAGLGQLEGVFAAAIWDKQKGRLVLYSDASCARSLYWLRGRNWAVAGTRLDLVVDLPGATKGVGRRGLLEYLRFLDVSPPNTIYAGVRALEPGAAGCFDGNELVYPQHSDQSASENLDTLASEAPPAQTKDSKSRYADTSLQAAADALDDALRQSIAARLRTDGLTGISLSGGIDSSLLCAIGADIAGDRVASFTLGFTDEAFDESPIASAIADHLGIANHCYFKTLDEYAEHFEDFLSRIDLPFADPTGLPTLLFFEHCRRHTDVLLDGTGADTLIGVMPARHTRIATQYAARLPRSLRRALGQVLTHLPIASQYAAIWSFDNPEDLLIRWKGWSRQEIESLMGSAVSLDHTRFYRLYRAFAHDAHFERYSALLGNLPDDRVHQAAELTGLRIRFPYWDQRVESVVRQLPQQYRFTEQEPKRLLREVLDRYVPKSMWDQPKHGFDFPFVAFLKHNDYSLVHRYLSAERLHAFDIISVEMVERYVGEFVAGNDELAFRIWALVVLFGWLEHHYDANPVQ